MAHVSTVQVNNQVYTYDQLQTMMANGTLDVNSIKDVSVFNQSNDQAAVKDGKDDGKVGFFEGLGSVLKGAVKGVVNGIKGMFTDENGKFSLGKTLKSAAMIGACFIPGVGPVIAAGMCAYGAVKGGVGLAKGISAAANATTDAEKHAALESCGANGVAVAASVAGLKGSVNQIATNAANAAGVKLATAGKTTLRADLGTIAKSVKTANANAGATTLTSKLGNTANTLTGNYYSSAWSSASGSTLSKVGQVAKQTTVDTAANISSIAPKLGKKSGKTTGAEATPKKTGKVKAGIDKKVETFKTNHPTTTKYYNAAKGKVNTFKSEVAASEGSLDIISRGTALKSVYAKTSADEAEKMTNNIANTYTTYANATIQTGREFDLEDYQVYSF